MSKRTILESTQRFKDAYGKPPTEAELAVEREVFGDNLGVHGYTTVGQAETLADRLALRPGMRLLDVGSGRGWPGLYLAQRTGCQVILTDVPAEGLPAAAARAETLGVDYRAVQASGTALPFRSRAFDAIVHTDAL